jgi:phosphatidylglycerol:prolipoprotein diacylglycerol transferase
VTYHSPRALAPLGVTLHPSQLYEAGLEILLFLVLNRLARAKGSSGKIFFLYLGATGLIRLFVEWTRGDHRGPVLVGLTFTQWIVVLGFFVAIAVTLSRGWVLLRVRKK